MEELREKKPRKASPTQQLADWFWLSVLQRDPTDRYINPDFRQLLSQSKYMLGTMGLEMETIQKAVMLMAERGEKPSSPNLVYLTNEPSTGKRWIELADNPLALCPPLYERSNCLIFLKQFVPDSPLIEELQRELA